MHKDETMKAQGNKNNNLYASILSLAKEGASKREIAEALSISDQQLRRLTAELVDRGSLRLDAKKGILLTTYKGHVFLQTKKSGYV
jgi:DNA-binding transcriptional regulator LsrR (DeoR family)